MRRTRWILLGCALAMAAGCAGDDEGVGGGDGTVDTADEPDSNIIIVDSYVPPDTGAVDTSEPVDTGPPEPGEFGYPCDGSSDCHSGWCVQTADGRRCTKTCVEDCPPFYDCREAPGTDAIFICTPRLLHLCDPCEEAADCNGASQTGNFCLSYGAQGRFCGVRCDGDPDCPDDYVCRLVPVGGGGEAKQCVPADGAQCKCSEYAKSLQLSTTCFLENEHGKCEGSRFCTQLGLNTCDADEPFPESCNGVDDNCNGVTDEFPPDYTCMIDNEFGSCPGAGTCVDGVETCEGTAPAPESCDGIDNDCDGETDEGLCDDQNPCTVDFCNDDGTCQHTPQEGIDCDDGNVCTQRDICMEGECRGFDPLPCGDGNPCFDYTCDPVAGCLSNFADGASCNDGEPCTVGDSCEQGVCVGGSWDTCNDGNECTADSCTAGQGCVNNPLSSGTCGSSTQCSEGRCSNGVCQTVAINTGEICSRSGLDQCEEGRCSGQSCDVFPKPSTTSCTVEPTGLLSAFDFCLPPIPGQCGGGGDCVPTQGVPGCTCSGGCALCVCCPAVPILGSFCLDGIFN